MKSLIVGDKPTVQRLAERLKRAGTHSEYQRIRCVLIRATLGSSAAEIAQLLGWSVATVHVMHSRWAKEGEAIFELRGRGGRHHEYLTAQQEQELLAPFTQRAQAGGMLTVAEIQQAYAQRFDRVVRDVDVEVVNWRVHAFLPGADISLAYRAGTGSALVGTRRVHFEGFGDLEASVHDRYALEPGTLIQGPAVVEERESSCSFGPDCECRVDEHFNLVIRIGAALHSVGEPSVARRAVP